MADTVFLAGGTRGVGLEIARLLVGRYAVRALVRPGSERTALADLGAEIVEGDALDADAVARALQVGPVAAAISTVGGKPQDGDRADYAGNRNLIDAAAAAGVGKFLLVSSIGAGESAIALPPQAKDALAAVLAEKERAEQHLQASGLTYVVVRPGGLLSEVATGTAVLTEDCRVAGSIARADVAELVCRCLVAEAANNKILSALDRDRRYGEGEFATLELPSFA